MNTQQTKTPDLEVLKNSFLDFLETFFERLIQSEETKTQTVYANDLKKWFLDYHLNIDCEIEKYLKIYCKNKDLHLEKLNNLERDLFILIKNK